MIMLGESLLSCMIKFGSLSAEARTTHEFYSCMSLVLLIAFSVGLLYFNLQPPRHENAMRRSFGHAMLVYLATSTLAPCILLMSVGVKHAMHAAITGNGGISSENTWMLHGSTTKPADCLWYCALNLFICTASGVILVQSLGPFVEEKEHGTQV